MLHGAGERAWVSTAAPGLIRIAICKGPQEASCYQGAAPWRRHSCLRQSISCCGLAVNGGNEIEFQHLVGKERSCQG